MNKYDYQTQMEYYQQSFDNMLSVPLDPYVYHEGVQYRFEYNVLINQCINHELKMEFSLMAHSEVQYCDVKENSKEICKIAQQFALFWIIFIVLFLDDLDVVFLVVFELLAFLVAFSSLYDICLRKMNFMHSRDPEYYHKSLISCEFNVIKYDILL